MATDGISGNSNPPVNQELGTVLTDEHFTAVVNQFSQEIQTVTTAVQTVAQVKVEAEIALAESLNATVSEAESAAKEIVASDAVSSAGSELVRTWGDRPASDGTYGKIEYIVRDGDTLRSIAAEHGLSVEDMLLSNPWLTRNTPLEAGMTIVFLDETRLNLSRDIAAASNLNELRALVQDYILYASVSSSTPEDLLPAIQADLLALRGSEDSDFAALVLEESAAAARLWHSQGRNHETMDLFRALSEQGDVETLRQELINFFARTASATPSAEAIEAQKEIFLAYGPDNDTFTQALDEAYFYFNVGQVNEAAAAIAKAYADLGPIAAAQKLAHYTSAYVNDLLTAARILNAAQPTVSKIITHLGYGDQHAWPGNTVGADYFHIDLSGKETIFGYLSQTVSRTSQSPDAAESIVSMADQINYQMYTYVARAIMDGKGVYLPAEMLRLSFTIALFASISVGINGLDQTTNVLIRAMLQYFPEAMNASAAIQRDSLTDMELSFLQNLQALRAANMAIGS